jgi:catechol 2,3-dioxygenase-like lactoylglutathione lyase family enzyme
MITGTHAIVFAKKAEATRKFFKDVLGMTSVDAGGGWLIFALPPAELGVHPADDGKEFHMLYFTCDHLERTMDDLKKKGVKFKGKVQEQPWGSLIVMKVPGAGEIGLYEPKHPSPSR